MKYDAIVVGTGASSSLVIDRFVKEGKKVLVLERGEDKAYAPETRLQAWKEGTSYALENGKHVTRNSWSGLESARQEANDKKLFNDLVSIENVNKDFRFNYNMRLGYGGSSAVWSGRTWRFYASDFQTSSKFSYGRDWSISYDKFSSFYDEAEQILNVSGPKTGSWPFKRNFKYDAYPLTKIDDVLGSIASSHYEIFKSANAVKNASALDGGCVASKTCVYFCPSNALTRHYIHFLEPHKKVDLLDIRYSCIVSHLDCSDDGFINKIHIIEGGKPKTIAVSKSCYLFMGCNTIENLRVLLNSERMTGKKIANSNGLLGRYFGTQGATVYEVVANQKLDVGRSRPSTSAGLDPEYGENRAEFNSHMLEIFNINWERGSPATALKRFQKDTKHWGRTLFSEADFLGRATMVSAIFEIELRYRNRVTLSDIKDDHGIPIAKVDFEMSPRDMNTFEMLNRVINSFEDHPSCDSVENKGFGLNGNHPLGGYVSGLSPSDGVVDRHCRSFDHPNLYLLGAGSFNSASCFNPTLTITANTLHTLSDKRLWS